MQQEIGVGMLGYGFMGKTHALGYRQARAVAPNGVPGARLVSIWGRNRDRLEEARERYGFERAADDWQRLIEDPEIVLIDNCGPNDLHVEPSIAAAKAGKHVYCEKPLAPDAKRAHEVWRAAAEAGIIHMCAFNYRFMPAIRHARLLIEQGEIGDVHHYRAQFLLSSSLEGERRKSWRDDRAQAGAGALGDLGSHHIDLCRYLAGEISRIAGFTRIAVPTSARGETIETDDAFVAIAELADGGLATLEASRTAGGHLVTSRIGIDGSRGSIAFSMQRLNELQVAGPDRAFKTVIVAQPDLPLYDMWFPAGHPLGWSDSFTHEAVHVLSAIAGLKPIAPEGATFEDGYRCAEVCDAILRSASSGRVEEVAYRGI